MKKYKFVGDGACVPGLPLEVSEIDIDLFNVEQKQAFDAALASGLYIEDGAETRPARSTKSKKPESGEGA